MKVIISVLVKIRKHTNIEYQIIIIQRLIYKKLRYKEYRIIRLK